VPSSYRSARTTSFWPREHGAYVQLLAPLTSALVFAGPSPAALACTALAAALFLAHEPLIVLLGQRGARCREASARAARAHLFVRLALAALLGLGLLIAAPSAVGLALLVPAAPSLGALAMLVSKREKSLLAELLAALALASFSIPVLVAQGISARSIGIFSAGWLAVHALATVTARAYVYRKREGERPLQAASLGALTLLGLAGLLAAVGHVPVAVAFALAPFTLVAIALRWRRYQPRTPKSLGWALASANLAAVVLFGTTLSPIP
jgi:hypothetical protein